MEQIKLMQVRHRGSDRILLLFDKDEALLRELRTVFPDLKWSRTHGSWHTGEGARDVPRKLFSKFRGEVWIDYADLKRDSKYAEGTPPENKKIAPAELPGLDRDAEGDLGKFKRYMRSKRYSESTIKTYSEAVRMLLRFFSDKKPGEIDNEDVIRFNNEYVLGNGYSQSYQNQVVNGIKLFYRVTENEVLDLERLHRPRRERKLPKVLSKEEVKAIIEATGNIKHRAFLSIIYGCGLRRSEAIHLKPGDIDSDRMLLHVIGSKGKKDRVVPLSQKLLELLRDYYKAYRPKVYLFEGQVRGNRYSEATARAILKRALKLSAVNKPVSLHWLRHSYATHLLEAGTDLRYIQDLLGHKKSTTTEIYTYVSTKEIQNIKSPFDDL